MAGSAETTGSRQSARGQDHCRLSPHGSSPIGGGWNVCSYRLSFGAADAKNSTPTALPRTSSPVLRCLELAETEVARERTDEYRHAGTNESLEGSKTVVQEKHGETNDETPSVRSCCLCTAPHNLSYNIVAWGRFLPARL